MTPFCYNYEAQNNSNALKFVFFSIHLISNEYDFNWSCCKATYQKITILFIVNFCAIIMIQSYLVSVNIVPRYASIVLLIDFFPKQLGM